MTDLTHLLISLLTAHPTAKVVTDVGASMFSGWGELKAVIYHEEDNIIELEFD